MRAPRLAWLTVSLGLLSACTSVMDRRISAHPEAWRNLSEQTRDRLRHGRVLAGDTEEMVRIALGAPDKALPRIGPDGRDQTVWVYEALVSADDMMTAASYPHVTSRDQTVILCNGVVVDPPRFTGNGRRFPPGIVADRVAERMTARLDRLLALTPAQKTRTREILEAANEKLAGLGPRADPAQAEAIARRMWTDVRALLTSGQRVRYDEAPHFFGRWSGGYVTHDGSR